MSLREDGTPRKKVNQEICQDPVHEMGSVCHVLGHTARAETPISSTSTHIYLCHSHSTSVSSSIALWCTTAVCQTATTPHPYKVEERPKCYLKCTWYRYLRERWKKCSTQNAVVAGRSRLPVGASAADWWVLAAVPASCYGLDSFRTRSWAIASHKGFSEKIKFFVHAIIKNLSCYDL